MPPQNSPTQLDGDFNLEARAEPQLTSSTRLPIIRPSATDDQAAPGWRALLERAIDQVSDSSQDWVVIQENHAAREEYRRRVAARHAERHQQYAMSTYRGWAPGTIELDRPLRNHSSRAYTGSDHLSRSNATRRYRREQEMNLAARPDDTHRTDEHRELRSVHTDPSRHIQHTSRSDSSPLRTAALLESFRRQARVENLRERLNSFTGTRGEDQTIQHHTPEDSRLRQQFLEQQRQIQQVSSMAEYARLTSEPELLNADHQGQTSLGGSRESQLAEKHMTKVFEEATVLLDGLRLCLNRLDRSTLLEESGFGALNRAEMLANEETLDTNYVLKPQPSSWLRPGASFSGQQKASIASRTVRFNRRSRRQADERSNNHAMMPPPDIPQPWTHGVVSAGFTEPPKDCWPVKVTITSVDYNNMTLTGTMEAFNVPNTKGTNLIPRDPNASSITTYLEGEIIDFHTHSLRTTNFQAGSGVDATYWRMLEPFKSLGINEIVDGFTDMKWLSKNLAEQWIIMRWKEKCFVSPSDSNSGLTISGFYYITLRRSDGKIEGLYHDPLSCPFQHLNLMPERSVFPVYAFR